VVEAEAFPLLPSAVLRRAGRYVPPLLSRAAKRQLSHTLRTLQPDFTLLSLGLNTHGNFLFPMLRDSGAPYALICNQAGEMYWPADYELEPLRAGYSGARFVGFVSNHNWRLTEAQLGMTIPQARLIRNPYLVPREERTDWPDDGTTRLACVARLWTPEKGQDLILRVLAQPKWKARSVRLSLFGKGESREGLEALARWLELDNIDFPGFVSDVSSIWNDHHALVLPSRIEGLPLALVEAMMSARVPIVTDVGGNAEIVTDGEEGFIAAAPTEVQFDDALERAWAQRKEWREMGHRASIKIRALVPERPELDMVAAILAEMER
jgi:glycosyltransferase involved in cell wall biosynthesis